MVSNDPDIAAVVGPHQNIALELGQLAGHRHAHERLIAGNRGPRLASHHAIRRARGKGEIIQRGLSFAVGRTLAPRLPVFL